jgi:hypothetical protein
MGSSVWIVSVAEARIPSHFVAELRPYLLPGGAGDNNATGRDPLRDFLGHSEDVTTELVRLVGWKSCHGCFCG